MVKIVNRNAVDVARLTQRMVSQYFSHHASMYVARDPRARTLGPPIESGQQVPVLKIPRGDGNAMIMWFDHCLAEGLKPEASADFDKVWFIGALITVGDAIGANGYFGHIPEAEIIRHLRNGIAHGNKFKFDRSVIDKAYGKLKYPANIFRYSKQQSMPMHEVDTNLDGTKVLFGLGGPDAIIDCLTVLGVHLWNVGHGMPPLESQEPHYTYLDGTSGHSAGPTSCREWIHVKHFKSCGPSPITAPISIRANPVWSA